MQNLKKIESKKGFKFEGGEKLTSLASYQLPAKSRWEIYKNKC